MSTAASIITYARYLAQTDSSGLTDTAGLTFTNDALQNFIRSLVERNIDAAQTIEAYTNLTTSAPNTYAWPSDLWSLKTIEVNFTDSSQNNYIQAQNVDFANTQGQSFDFMRVNQPTTAPLFKNSGDTYEIVPTPTLGILNGIKIIYFQIPTEYSATSTALSYPVTLDYRCLGARVAALYKMSLGDFNASQAFNDEYQKRLNDIIRILAPASQQPITPKRLGITGWEF